MNIESNENDNSAKTSILKFEKIIDKAKHDHWQGKPMGDVLSLVANEFIKTPYIVGTLDTDTNEKCIVNLIGLDCVTFNETVLGLSRIIKKGKADFKDLTAEIILIRYRSGIMTDYTSRLHYTAEWIKDIETKGICKDITKEIGGEKFQLNVCYMSDHPDLYKALKNNKKFVEVIKQSEIKINSKQHYFISKERLKNKLVKFKTGDIVSIATNKKGLDYAHVGIAIVDNQIVKFIHASYKKKEVSIEPDLDTYLRDIKSDIGITVVRPLELN
ncbi:MAG: DUF1460 domain-containing protein [Candidatus Kapabacteria bacterium]|nr:DUF1460 domain-containing protein [Candidatus Kapabacteria bacterium]